MVDDDSHRLKALVYPDFDSAKADGVDIGGLEQLIEQEVKGLNKDLPGYSQIAAVKILNEEFEKTPKRSIKRYLYK